MTSLPDFKPSFPSWHPKDLTSNVAGATPESTEMLAVRFRPFSVLIRSTLSRRDRLRRICADDPLRNVRECSYTTRQRGCRPRRHSNAITSEIPLTKPKSSLLTPRRSPFPLPLPPLHPTSSDRQSLTFRFGFLSPFLLSSSSCHSGRVRSQFVDDESILFIPATYISFPAHDDGDENTKE